MYKDIFCLFLYVNRDLRAQIVDQKLEHVVLGPDAHALQMSDAELTSQQQQTINRLRDDLSQALNELDALKLRVCLGITKSSLTFLLLSPEMRLPLLLSLQVKQLLLRR